MEAKPLSTKEEAQNKWQEPCTKIRTKVLEDEICGNFRENKANINYIDVNTTYMLDGHSELHTLDAKIDGLGLWRPYKLIHGG